MTTLRQFIRNATTSPDGTSIRVSLNNLKDSNVFTQSDFNLYLSSYVANNNQVVPTQDKLDIAQQVWNHTQ